MELSLRNVIGKVYSALWPCDGLDDLSNSPPALFYDSEINSFWHLTAPVRGLQMILHAFTF